MSLRALTHREVPRDWETQLAEFSPPQSPCTCEYGHGADGCLSWLKLIWEPGDPWGEPVERFLIYQMIPRHAIRSEILMDLERSTPPQGYYDAVKREYVREEGNCITKRAWHLYQTTQCWGTPWWVIQGKKGGHLRWFSPEQRRLLSTHGLPEDPPAPGNLPYAPFDDLVLEQITKHDLLRDENGRLSGNRSALSLTGFRQRQDEDARKHRKKLLAWLSDQLDETGAELHRGLVAADTARRDIDVKRLEEAAERSEENFIEHGRA